MVLPKGNRQNPLGKRLLKENYAWYLLSGDFLKKARMVQCKTRKNNDYSLTLYTNISRAYSGSARLSMDNWPARNDGISAAELGRVISVRYVHL